MSHRRKLMIEYFTKIKGENTKGEENMTMARAFQQFFTPPKYSQIMINALDISNPKKIIDLAMGEGSLLIETMKRWEEASFYGNDIDPNCCHLITQEHPDISCYNNDIFLNSSINELLETIGKVDLCVANPPFHLIPQDDNIRELLKEFALDKSYKSAYIASEIPFILQNFKILNEGGTLAIILPDGFFTNKKLLPFRQFLISNYSIERVIELPEKIFKNTHAKTHIIILKNQSPTSTSITLTQHIKSIPIMIPFSDAFERMDYSYYQHKLNTIHTTCLAQLDVTFIRGKSKYLIEDINEKHILHTTSFRKNNIFKNNLKTINKLKKYQNKLAIPGDIVISRVGSNCIGKVGLVQKGYFIITDCIFIIRTGNIQLREIIYDTLISTQGQEWIQAHSKGVAARHITLQEIKQFPLSKKALNDI